MAMAWMYPVDFVKVVASLMPREAVVQATANVQLERMSDAQLDALIAQCLEGGLDPAATDEDAQIIQ